MNTEQLVIQYYKECLESMTDFYNWNSQVYLKAMSVKKTFDKFWMISPEMDAAFDKLTIRHIGLPYEELSKLIDQFAYNNVCEKSGIEIRYELTIEQISIITEWFKYDHALPSQKNENPFL
jgi:hypothetical protein